MQRGLPMQPTVVLLREGTDTSQGNPQLLSNISACLAIAETLSSTLGPRGMDKLIVSDRGEAQITNDGATILKLLDIVHPAARTLVDIARAQDAEVGDGTTSVVLLAAQLLKEVRSFIEEGVSPHIIMKGFRKASQMALQRIKEIQITVDKSDPERFRSLLLKCASTSMSSKLIHSEKPFFSNMVVDAVQCLDQNDLDESLIGVKKIAGGGMQDSLLIKGVAFKKTFTYAGAEQQPKSFRNPLIVCLNVELELKAEKDNAEVRVDAVSDYQAIVNAEWEIIYRKLQAVEKTGAKVVLSKLPIGDLATQWFADRDIFCAGRVAAGDLRRVVQATGGAIQSTCSDIAREHLGTCGRFEERQIGGERYNLFEDCPKSKTCTLVLRGGAEQFMEEVERSLHDAIMVVKRAVKNGEVVAGGGAIEMDLSAHIRKHALSIPGKQQLIMTAFAKALEIIPRQICDNAGIDSTDILNKLRMKHANGEKWAGVDVDGASGVRDNMDAKESSERSAKSGAESTASGLWGFWKQSAVELDSIATQRSVFDDPVTLEAYRPPPQYENTHRFDPAARWTWREEKRVVRKIDLYIMIWAAVMFFALNLDRSNISQANTDNFLEDLNMTTDDFNLGNSLFRLSFLIAELPCQLVSKKLGPDIWIPCQMVCWSIVALGQFWLRGRTTFLLTRFLLGFCEGGFIPDVVLYLSYFYTKRELPIRFAYFWVSNYVSQIVSAFMATGILQLRGVGGKAGWRWLFLLEGIMTLAIGIASFLMMPPGPTQTKMKYVRPNGWFDEREETIMVNRVLRDDPSKSDMHNREGLSARAIFEALKDWRLWPLYCLGLVHMIPTGPPQVYLTLSLKNLGFTTTQSNLLTIPSTVCGLVTLLLCAYLSEIIDSRVGATIILQFWALPLLIALYTFNTSTSQWVYFGVVTLITGFPYVHPIQVAWASRNSYSVRTRTISASCYNMFVQAGAIIYSNIYRTDDKPLYKRGNRVLIGICCMNIVLYILTFFFYRHLNRMRDKKWNAWSKKEQQEYVENTKDVGNQRLDFRFAY
ncbi:T-complex protein eta subunit [Mycena sanguinolenta]|uniref:CCT-eta n=1 Tax=Mycena sanguinolenta TaxID=230812 RepID=A0A8H7CIZ1_9AGAR|nr:T-complex protein eta subunit [Mycena sanguinolenta]